MRSLCVAAWIALASVGAADAATLTFSFEDAAGDGTASGDLQSMHFEFDNATGDYAIELRAYPTQPFVGDLQIHVNLFNPDTGSHFPLPAAFQDNNNDFDLAAPTTRILLTGTNGSLVSWKAGDRVAANHIPFGSWGHAGGGGPFATRLVDLPGPSSFCASAEDCLGPFDATNFTTIAELVTVFDNFDADGGFHPQDNLVAASSIDTLFLSSTVRMAARFTVAGGPVRLDSITLPISVQGAPIPILRVRLTEDAGGVPGATLEVLSEDETIWPSFANPFATTTTLTSTVGPLLEEGASYWIVTEPTAFLPSLNVDYRWFTNTSDVDVVTRSQQRVSGLVEDPWTGQQVLRSPAFRVDGSPTECSDGIDNDGDGLIDALDPGCASPSDLSEQDPTLPCDDGVDNDGDGGIDHRPSGGGDPACQTPESPREDPACDDDVDNDGDGKIDWDGGSAGGIVDPQCVDRPWHDRERASCGLGPELLLPLALLRRRRALRRIGDA